MVLILVNNVEKQWGKGIAISKLFESLGSSQACGPGGSGERFWWKGRLPILWCRSLNPRQGAQDFECVTKYCFLKKKKKKLFPAAVRTLTESVL